MQIASEQEILIFMHQHYGNRKKKYYGFYTSALGKVITDEKYMLLPVDDRTATRAHGVFDVIYINKLALLNLDQHVDRLFDSAASLYIEMPFDKEKTKEVVKSVC